MAGEMTVHVQELRMRDQAQERREGEGQAQEEITHTPLSIFV
jgi:hypothetical protein